MWHEARELYVFPKHCNHVCFYLDMLDRDWWFVLIHGPRSKRVFKSKNVIMPSVEEDNQGVDNGE